MKWPYLLLSCCALVASASSAYSNEHNPFPVSRSETGSSRLVSARFFADPANRNLDVRAVREHMERRATLAGHYSQSVVGCGAGCVSFWIVDRRAGAIIDLPLGARDAEFVYDV